jgi:hypothetical protein
MTVSTAAIAAKSAADRLVLAGAIVIAVVILCWFVIPGYILGALLTVQGVKSRREAHWPRVVFAPTLILAYRIPALGSFYEAQLDAVWRPAPMP